jgi:hypothetical protein
VRVGADPVNVGQVLAGQSASALRDTGSVIVHGQFPAGLAVVTITTPVGQRPVGVDLQRNIGPFRDPPRVGLLQGRVGLCCNNFDFLCELYEVLAFELLQRYQQCFKPRAAIRNKSPRRFDFEVKSGTPTFRLITVSSACLVRQAGWGDIVFRCVVALRCESVLHPSSQLCVEARVKLGLTFEESKHFSQVSVKVAVQAKVQVPSAEKEFNHLAHGQRLVRGAPGTSRQGVSLVFIHYPVSNTLPNPTGIKTGHIARGRVNANAGDFDLGPFRAWKVFASHT